MSWHLAAEESLGHSSIGGVTKARSTERAGLVLQAQVA
jgi:hypothetical protein